MSPKTLRVFEGSGVEGGKPSGRRMACPRGSVTGKERHR